MSPLIIYIIFVSPLIFSTYVSIIWVTFLCHPYMGHATLAFLCYIVAYLIGKNFVSYIKVANFSLGDENYSRIILVDKQFKPFHIFQCVVFQAY